MTAIPGKQIMVYSADVAAESAARYAAEQALHTAGGGAAAGIGNELKDMIAATRVELDELLAMAPGNKVVVLENDLVPTLNAAAARLQTASEKFTTVINGGFYSNSKRKPPFNEGFQAASTAVGLLKAKFPKDPALIQAGRGINSIGKALTGTFGATPNRAAQMRGHVNGVLADLRSGRFGKLD